MPQKPERAVVDPLLVRPRCTPKAGIAGAKLAVAFAMAMPVGVATVAAQTPTAEKAIDFRTADGSRVVLVPVAGPPLVHWAMATPCGPQVDPVSAPGTAAAAVQASLRGTWTTGSFDADKERAALAALDAAETDLALAPRTAGKPPAELEAAVARLRVEAAALADPLAFRRVMAALPTQDLRVSFDSDVAVLELSTTPFAVAAVARLLRERREEPALRSVRADLQTLQDRATAAWDAAPLSPLYAEVLALAFPGHALARSGDRPAASGFQRALAIATWARSQHPTRTVHVLIGNFDPAAVRTVLERTFADTSLLLPEPLVAPQPRAQPAVRRSLVPGARHPAAVLAFPIAADMDPLAAAAAAHWFADGDGSWLHSELVRQGRKKVEVAVRAPWPQGASPGLLVVEATDPGGGAPTLADEVLKLCAAQSTRQPRPGELPGAFGTVLRQFEQRTRSPLDTAGLFAARLLQSPGITVARLQPHNIAYPELPALLQRILDGNPIVIEWRDS